MPIELRTQQAVRPPGNSRPVYLCGLAFQDGDQKNRDHVPPSAIFLEADRNFPLIPPTHYLCKPIGIHDFLSRVAAQVAVLSPRPKTASSFSVTLSPVSL